MNAMPLRPGIQVTVHAAIVCRQACQMIIGRNLSPLHCRSFHSLKTSAGGPHMSGVALAGESGVCGVDIRRRDCTAGTPTLLQAYPETPRYEPSSRRNDRHGDTTFRCGPRLPPCRNVNALSPGTHEEVLARVRARFTSTIIREPWLCTLDFLVDKDRLCYGDLI